MRTRSLFGILTIASAFTVAGNSVLTAAVQVVQANYTVNQFSDPSSFVYLYPTMGFSSPAYNNTTSAIKLTASSSGLQASNEYTGRVAASDKFFGDWYATEFAAGELIEATDFQSSGVIQYLFLPGSGVHNQFTLGGGSGYIGFSYVDGSSLTHYGWALVSINDGINDPVLHNYGLTLHEWAYETTANTPIAAGSYSSIPEPASCAALVGLLVLGVGALRRRR